MMLWVSQQFPFLALRILLFCSAVILASLRVCCALEVYHTAGAITDEIGCLEVVRKLSTSRSLAFRPRIEDTDFILQFEAIWAYQHRFAFIVIFVFVA